jgi:hypothetical protein
MHFRVVLNGVEQIVERIVRGPLGERREGLLGVHHIFAAHRFAQCFAADFAFGQFAGLDRMKDLLFASAFFLNAVGVPVKNFEDRQRLLRLRQLAREMQRRRQRHHRVETT